MNIREFVVGLADKEGNEEIQKYVLAFWEQASEEDRKSIVLGIDQQSGHMRKLVKSFWAFCGVHITGNWVSVNGKTYAIAPFQPHESRVTYPKLFTGMNADFEGIMPGVDQMLYDQANAKALAQAASAIDPTGMHPLSQEPLPPELTALSPDEIAGYINTALTGSYDSRPQHKFKLTDRHGDRGVICTVLPDDQMPLDKEGNRAEIVIFDNPAFKVPVSLLDHRSVWNSLSGEPAPEGFDITIPTLMEGDVHHRTHVTSNCRVLHVAHDPDGNQAIYSCTQRGLLMMRQLIKKGFNLQEYLPLTETYTGSVEQENLTKNRN